VVHAVLFPFHAMYARQAQVKYDPWKNTYTIQGIELSGCFFSMFNDDAARGTVFKFVNTDNGVITLEIVKQD